MNPLLTVKELAQMLNLSERTIHKFTHEDYIPHKRLEYDLAVLLNGKRVSKKHYGDSCPDVIKELSDGRRLICDAKRRKSAAVVNQIEKVESKYFSKDGDIALIYTHPHFKHTGVVSVRREFFVELLRKARLI